ncbi:MAG: hypothetical protein ACFFCI_09330 [Promethearchaeota archaeon]
MSGGKYGNFWVNEYADIILGQLEDLENMIADMKELNETQFVKHLENHLKICKKGNTEEIEANQEKIQDLLHAIEYWQCNDWYDEIETIFEKYRGM